VRRALEDWGLADDARVAELLTSELVTNAVLHAATSVMLTISCRDNTVRVEIGDAGTEMPSLVEVPDTGGYGLRLVDRMASRWGVEQVPGTGKTVWFELDVGP
jgi:anti-sigma regulatory factor (Ser/Thr protein kinase)